MMFLLQIVVYVLFIYSWLFISKHDCIKYMCVCVCFVILFVFVNNQIKCMQQVACDFVIYIGSLSSVLAVIQFTNAIFLNTFHNFTSFGLSFLFKRCIFLSGAAFKCFCHCMHNYTLKSKSNRGHDIYFVQWKCEVINVLIGS